MGFGAPLQKRIPLGRRFLNSVFGHCFADESLLEKAFTHRSAASAHNERLEFLGDAILGMLVAEKLYQLRPQASEGELTRLRSHLVQEKSLARIAKEHGLIDAMVLGPGELKSGAWRRASILADAVEAVLAAIYLDAGLDAARDAVNHVYADRWHALPQDAELKDPKTLLQEWLQARGLNRPVYQVLEVAGPDHRKLFRVEARIGSAEGQAERVEIASSTSRRGAEQDAARALLQSLEQNS